MSASSVLYIVTEPWYFANHRLDHARALIAGGFDVHVATRPGERWDEIAGAGCCLHAVELERGSGGPVGWLREGRAVRRIVRETRPAVVHGVALKPVALSLFVLAMRRRPALILSVNGLGLTSTQAGSRLRVIRTVLRAVSRWPRVHLLFQTRADQRAILGRRDAGVVIPGVGVDTTRFHPRPRSSTPPFDVVYLGRAVVSKGLSDLADAMAAQPVADVRLHLYCAIDELSPGSLDASEMARIASSEHITLHPPTREPEVVLGAAHGAILPSRSGEGVSKFVLEALASGTPVLLSAESGSVEVIEPGTTGLVFCAGDAASIRSALADLASLSADRREAMGVACRQAAERQYALDVIAPQIVDLHRRAAGVGAP